MKQYQEQLGKLHTGFAEKKPEEILEWALGTYMPDLALACSFGAEDMVLLEMMMKLNKEVPVFFLDTSFHFSETYEIKRMAEKRYGITIEAVAASFTLEEQEKHYGKDLWNTNPELCCQLRKVDPLTHRLSGLRAWITGIRREQSITRQNARIVEWDYKFRLTKINPLVMWSEKEVWYYINQHRIPYHSLHDHNYPSIGCAPCTSPIEEGEDRRSGRWRGLMKTECGLHGWGDKNGPTS
ncbi:phosphoadenylyl-sulfate reductase [Microaerobacter geothermalis]|uniref:phosphoadenylyl-sulfate reductase n=1 Tax=Microaerobacter geothermalis TaxID=674972 RepID=UPI001F2E009E|nr:phosphoadenylyl-sulfate reductase [Microaerobacter geothermalis]MCF6095279.1 phosphoadenylyl-sulfate reductase [Microaerobacter geothermalis]